MKKLNWFLKIWRILFPEQEKEKVFLESIGCKRVKVKNSDKWMMAQFYRRYTKSRTLQLWMKVDGLKKRIYLDAELYDKEKVIHIHHK